MSPVPQHPPEQLPALPGELTEASFGPLFTEHARPLHGYLSRRVGSAIADDLVAEVRALRATARLDPGVEAGPEDRVAERVDAAARVRRLAAALARLDDGDRDVLLLTSWAGLSAEEVGAALNVPAGTVRSRLHRVRRKLRAAAPHPTASPDGESDD